MVPDRYDPWALPVLSAWPKVLQIVKGAIPRPEVVEIFPTNYCNFHCPHCRFKHHHGGAAAFAELALMRRLLEELAGKRIENIELSGGGEPLIHPNAAELFDCLIDGKFRVGLITNGYPFIDQVGLQERVVACCTWIRISADAFTDETYQRVHGGKRLSYGLLKNALISLRKRAAGSPRIGIKMLISKLNVGDVQKAITEAIDIGADYLQLKSLGFPADLVLSGGEVERVSGQIGEQLAALGPVPLSVDFLPSYRGALRSEKCLMTFLHPVVDWDGEVYVCPFFEHRKQRHSLGNIRSGGFFEVWDAAGHRAVFDAVDSLECIPNCPMSRYNPLVDFMVAEEYRRGFF